MAETSIMRLTNRAKYALFAAFVCFCALVVALAGYLNYRGLSESRQMLKQSVEAQVLSIASAAREVLDVNAFVSYETADSIDNQYYRDQLDALRALARQTGAKYLYALKMIDGKAVFIFDTDESNENATLTIYQLSAVHEAAFQGREAAGLSNLVDEYGSFSSGAVPLMKGGQVAGIVCADVDDALVRKNDAATRGNFILLMTSLGAILAVMALVALFMLNRIKSIQDALSRMANYDRLTNLPNRLFLMSHLHELTARKRKDPFALFFVDLDNFKKVNDSAGHDAGDSLLSHIGEYLNSAPNAARAFRPGSGGLNVTARIGGDEFLLVVPGVRDEAQAAAFAESLLGGFASSRIDRYIEKYQVGLSIGIALYPHNSEDYHVLIKYADIAMYHAKRSGKNCYRVYRDEMRGTGEK